MDNSKTGLTLYKLFKTCLEEGKERDRLKRLESRLEAWYGDLTQPQRHLFCALLVKEKLVTGVLAAALTTFDAALVKIGKE